MQENIEGTASCKRRSLARELKETFVLLSPLIEKHTSVVCPDCEELCCMDRHGRYDKNDLVFLGALGVEVCGDSQDLPETDGCRHMIETGCSLHRWMRPWRCTYFFCDTLIRSIESDDPKLYRTFSIYLKHLVSLRQRFLE